MPVVEGKTDAVQTQALEEGGIGIGEEIFKKLKGSRSWSLRECFSAVVNSYLVPEEIRLLRSDLGRECLPDLELAARVA